MGDKEGWRFSKPISTRFLSEVLLILGLDHHGNSSHLALRARGLQRQVMPGGGEGNQRSCSSSSSSLSSLSSPTDSQEPGGVTDLTPQPMSEGVDRRVGGTQGMLGDLSGHAQSTVATGRGPTQRAGEWESSSLSHPQSHGENQQDFIATTNAGNFGEWSSKGQRHEKVTGQHMDMSRQRAVDPSWRRLEERPMGQRVEPRPAEWPSGQRVDPEEQPTGQDVDTSWQRYGGPTNQPWQRHEEQPTGQSVDVRLGDQPAGQGVDPGETIGGQGLCAGGQGQSEGSYVGGQSTQPYTQGQREESYAGGQSTPHTGTSAGSETVTYPPLHLPSSALPSYPPPSHHKPQAMPPHGNPSFYHQSSYPHSFPYYQSHAQHHPALHAPQYSNQPEVDTNVYGGSGLTGGGWGQLSYGGYTSLGSGQTSRATPGGSTGVPYQYFEGEGSLWYSSSQPSSLGTLSETGHRYGDWTPHQSAARFDTGFELYDDQGERCHSYPLSSYPHHRYDPRDPQPPYQQQQHGRVSSSSSGSQLSRHSNWVQHSTGEQLAGELRQRLTITEDTPAGEDEKHSEVYDAAKHAVLTMLDSDRIEILEQPKDLKVRLHQKAVFTCKARALDAGTARGEGVKQQWYKGEEVMEGENGTDLVFVRVERRHIGLYFCVSTHPDDDSVKKCSYVAQLAIKGR